MSRGPRKEVFRTKEYEVQVVGIARPGLRDLYHWMLTIPASVAALLVTCAWLALNAVFAGLYLVTGGLAGAAPGSFVDAYFLSVQTLGTIGYGAISPSGVGANVLVVLESIAGLAFTSLATGLVFVRFSLQRARMVFSKTACIAPMDGVPTLMIRLGNDRRSRVVDATFRLSVTRTTTTAEGVTIYRTVDLELVRDHATALSRAWNVMHRLGPGSPLEGATQATLAASDAELTLLVTGTDDTSMQPVHAVYTWMASDVAFGHRLADIVTEKPNGDMLVDLRRFHDIVSAAEPNGAPSR